jgi:single-strand DNA-binding protein
MNYNKAILQGTITTEVALSTTTSGKSMVVFGMATSNHFTTADGEKKTEPIFHRIVAWGKLAELIKSMSCKGYEILIDGKIINRKYKKKDGSTGFSSEVYANEYQIRSKNKKVSDESIPELESEVLDTPDCFKGFDDIQL